MARKAPPFQVVLMMACVGALMFISWLSISGPEAREENKARTTLIYFLEAAGKVPVEKIGKELHPTIRRRYNHETLKEALAALGLDKPSQLSDLSEGVQTFTPRQWEWDFKNNGEPMHAFLQYPEEMKISRRWHVRGICQPEQELPKVSQQLAKRLQNVSEDANLLSENKTYARLLQEVTWPAGAVSVDSSESKRLRMHLTLADRSLMLQWRMEPGKTLNCSYALESYRLKPQKGATS